jgi:hypothetical protein
MMSYLEEILQKEREGLIVTFKEPVAPTPAYYRKAILIGDKATPNDWYPLTKFEYEQYQLRKGERR